ncbi:MAG: hypothetical protein ACI4TG_07575 [Ruminococcus sp.]
MVPRDRRLARSKPKPNHSKQELQLPQEACGDHIDVRRDGDPLHWLLTVGKRETCLNEYL